MNTNISPPLFDDLDQLRTFKDAATARLRAAPFLQQLEPFNLAVPSARNRVGLPELRQHHV